MKKLVIAVIAWCFVATSMAAGSSVIDGNKISSREELHAKLAKDLKFPIYYGGNLDSLFEVLVSEKEAVLIKIVNLHTLEKKISKKYTEGLIETISDASVENPKIILILSNAK